MGVKDCCVGNTGNLVPRMVTLTENLDRTEAALFSINAVISELNVKLYRPETADCGCEQTLRPRLGILEQVEANMLRAEALLKDLSDLVERL